MKNLFISHFHQFFSECIDILVLNLDLSWDIENFYALLRFSDSGNVDQSNPWSNKGMSDVNGCYIRPGKCCHLDLAYQHFRQVHIQSCSGMRF